MYLKLYLCDVLILIIIILRVRRTTSARFTVTVQSLIKVQNYLHPLNFVPNQFKKLSSAPWKTWKWHFWFLGWGLESFICKGISFGKFLQPHYFGRKHFNCCHWYVLQRDIKDYCTASLPYIKGLSKILFRSF